MAIVSPLPARSPRATSEPRARSGVSSWFATLRDALERLLADPGERAAMGAAARVRAVAEFSHDQLAARLAPIAAGDLTSLEPLT